MFGRKPKKAGPRFIATFRVDFAEEVSGDDVGGRNVALAIMEIIPALGWGARGPIDDGDHGWAVDVTSGGRTVWCQTLDLGEVTLLNCGNDCISPPDFVEFLRNLNVALRQDGRFHDIRWFTPEDLDFEGGGAPSPVDEGV